MRNKVTILLFLYAINIDAQHLTISTSGQTGTSGTNWSISGSTLNVATSGSANIHPNVISNHLNSVGNLTVVLPWQSGVSRQCSINGTITYTGSATRTLTFLIANDIFMTSPNQSITATGSGALNVVLRAANAGGVSPDNGRVYITQNNTINTNGGHLWIGGGSGNVTWNGLTVGNSLARTWSDDVPGLWIENSTLNTNGGNVYLAGLSHNSSANSGMNYGVHMLNSDISSVSGNIEINGELNGRYQIGNGIRIESSTTTATSITTTTGSIIIRGTGYDQTTNDNGYRFGAVITGSSSTAKTIISSTSGNIQIEGNAYFAATVNDKEGLAIGGSTEIISRSGNITIRGTNSLETSGQYSNSIRFGATNNANSIRVGFDGTNSYSGNILIEGNSIYQRTQNTGSGSIAIQTTGNLTIQPTGNAFTYMRAGDVGTLTFDDDWNFGINLGSFTFGKSTNTTDITLTNDIRTNGPITIYANKINLGVGVSIITNNSNGNINLLANNGFETLASSGSIRGNISPNGGGKVHINADADNNNTGELNIDYTSFNGTTGDMLLEGATLNWNTGSINELPNFFGTGGLTIRRTLNSTNTGGFSTQWIAMFDTKAFITFGHPNNLGNINLTACTVCWQPTATNAIDKELTSSGPIQVFGENIILSSNLNLTSSGNGQKILFRARNRIEIGNGSSSSSYRQLKTNNGDIVLWSNAQNATDGGIIIGDWVTLNTANGSTTQSSGGGKIWLAGGSAVNSDSLPTGTANGGTSRTGISLGSFSPGATTTSFYSGGGDIFLNGESNANIGLGISWNRTGICHAGNGLITLKGEGKNASGAHGVELGAYSGSIDILSNGGSSTSPAISIEGKTARNDYSGMQTAGNRIQATGAGGISIVSIANNGGNSWSNNLGTNLLAASGDILISAQGGLGLRYSGIIGKLAGSNVTSSSSNITIRTNQLTINNSISVDATGQLVIEPFGTSFTNALTWPVANFSTATGLTGLRLGKDGNLANITISSPQSINGPISIFGGIITTNANLVASAINSSIVLKGNKIIQNQGVIVQSNNGDITYNVANAPWSASSNDQGISVGVWNGSTARINAQGGNISMTASFASTGQTNTGTFADVAIRFDNTEVITDKSGTINIDGNGYDNASTTGDYVWGGLYLNTLIQTDSGSISLRGTGGRSISNSRGITADLTNLKILSKLGAITLTDAMPIGHVGTNHTGAYFRPSAANAIQIGADGNLVPTSSSNIIFNVDRLTFDATPSNINTSGTVSIRPVGNDFTSGVDLTQLNVINSSGFTVGKSATSADGTGDASVTMGSCSIPGPISVFGGGISANQNLNTSIGDSNASILLKSSSNIILATNRSITTNGGDVTLWADSDGNGSGYIQTTGGANSGITTGGGDIFLGGGTTLATGYARGVAVLDAALGTSNMYISGVHLRDGTNINSGGGNITMRGQNVGNNQNTIQFGIMGHNTTVDAGSGKISLTGLAGGSGGASGANSQGISHWGNGWVIRSSNADADAISLVGDASLCDNSTTSLGINFTGTIEATGGGGVYMYGKSSTAAVYDQPLDIYGNILADSGNIIVIAENNVSSQTGLFMGNNATFGSKIGTNVTSSKSKIILKSDNPVFNAATNFNTSGTVSILPLDASNSFGVAETIGNNTVLATNVSGLTIGKSSNTANIIIDRTINISGPIEVFGGDITVNQNLNTSSGDSTAYILLKASNKINLASNRSITTNGGDVSLWADSDDNSTGYVQLLANAAVNTNGGDISLGGGTDLATDYAFGTISETCPEVAPATQYISGIHLRTGVNLNSNGGNISLRGQNANTTASAMSFGISLRGVSMNSGTGKISLNGIATGSSAVNAQGVTSWGTLTLRSANTSSDAISISGNAFTSSGTGSSLGINLVALFEATGNGGGIILNGKSGSAPTNASVNVAGDFLATSGPISLSGENSSGNYDNILIGTSVFGKKSGTNVTSSNSNITFEGNIIVAHAPVSIDGSGTLTIRPFGNSFTNALTFPNSNLSIANTITGLTIGKSTNTANITIGATTSIAGPITAYGGTIAINENLTSSNGSRISLFGNGLTFGANKTVTSNNGQLIITPQTASNTIGIGGATGTLSLPASYFSTNFSDGFANIQIGSDSQTGNIASNAFTLRDNMTFLTSGSLTLGGKPILGNNNITLGSSISSISANASNYFQTNGTGKVISTLANNAARLYPVGNAFYNGVTITNKTNATDTFSVLIKDSVLGNGDTGRQITTPHVKATWDISKNNTNGGNGVDFEFNWSASQEVGGINTFVLNHHNDTVWQIASGTAGSVSGTTTKSMSHTGYMGRFSPFAFGPGVTPLPVELIKFQATCQSDYIQIDWTTASEKRNKAFELFKSDDAQDWKLIHTIEGQGTKATETKYSFNNLDKKAGYYRLKDIDEDGIENWSQIIFAACKNEVAEVQIYPNPASDYIKVIVPFKENTTLKILNLEGKIVKTMPLVSNQTLVSVKDIVNGIYMIELSSSNEKIKFVKE